MSMTFEEMVKYLESMGYNTSDAISALKSSDYSIHRAIEYLSNKKKDDLDPQTRQAILQSEQEYSNKQAFGLGAQDIELSKAIEQSMKDNGVTAFDGNLPEDRVRKSGIPVGLCNVGNSIIVNRLLFQFLHPNLLHGA